MSASQLLVVEDLSVGFRSGGRWANAVKGVSLVVAEGETIGLVGESGCGKSATALAVVGLLPRAGRVTGGRVMFRGQDLLGLSRRRLRRIRGREIAMVFQDPLTYLNPTLRIGTQIAEKFWAHETELRENVRAAIATLLREVGLPAGVEERYPHELSGGMRQRVLIAIALACGPSLIIADEPTSALDVTTQAQILELFRALQRSRKTAFLLITHDLGVAAELCDDVCVMYAGQIVERGSVFDVLERPGHPYTQGLLASVLSIDEFRASVVTLDGTPPDLTDPPAGCRFHPRCPHATAVCAERVPPVVDVGAGHEVMCWLKVTP
jgi:oligopeptide/dipeptide ABC transporter ATP-binding protein